MAKRAYKKKHLVVCDECGKMFRSTKPDAKVCSQKCRQRQYRKRGNGTITPGRNCYMGFLDGYAYIIKSAEGTDLRTMLDFRAGTAAILAKIKGNDAYNVRKVKI